MFHVHVTLIYNKSYTKRKKNLEQKKYRKAKAIEDNNYLQGTEPGPGCKLHALYLVCMFKNHFYFC